MRLNIPLELSFKVDITGDVNNYSIDRVFSSISSDVVIKDEDITNKLTETQKEYINKKIKESFELLKLNNSESAREYINKLYEKVTQQNGGEIYPNMNQILMKMHRDLPNVLKDTYIAEWTIMQKNGELPIFVRKKEKSFFSKILSFFKIG